MTRADILKNIKKFFSIEELACDHTIARDGERSWRFIDTLFLHCLLVIRRDILQAPMICNHPGATQRGLRCNLCELVKSKTTLYLSGHKFGKAGDFTVKGMTAEQARQRIKENAHLLPCSIRLEAGVNWLHFDVMPEDGCESKVYEFKK